MPQEQLWRSILLLRDGFFSKVSSDGLYSKETIPFVKVLVQIFILFRLCLSISYWGSKFYFFFQALFMIKLYEKFV